MTRRATDKAEAILEEARDAHERAMSAIEGERQKLDRRAKKEMQRWEPQGKQLVLALIVRKDNGLLSRGCSPSRIRRGQKNPRYFSVAGRSWAMCLLRH